VAILLLSFAIRRISGALAATGVVLAVLGLVGTVLSTAGQFSSALYLGLGVGGSERLAGYPGNLWMLIIGALALARLGGYSGSLSAVPPIRKGSVIPS
jgi:hypothetical protein